MRHQNNIPKQLIPEFERRMFFRFVSTKEAGIWTKPQLVSGEILSKREISFGWHMVNERTADIYIPSPNGGRKVSAPPAAPPLPTGTLPERGTKLKQKTFILNNIFFQLLPEDLK